MDDERFRNKYRIPSARAEWHNYNGGTYFVTICTQNREQHFGKIVYDQNDEAQMDYTEMGRYANEQFKTITDHYPYAEIPLWVVMPNHVHCLVVIQREGAEDACRDVARYVSTTTTNTDDGGCSTKNEYMSQKSPKTGSLAAVIRGFKSAVTKFANENGIYFQWQTRFHDRIVRDWDELNRIADYIKNNPARWMQDKFYSA